MRVAVAILLLAPFLVGCLQLEDDGVPFVFDGQGAYDSVRLLVEHPDGSPRFRVPGTEGHVEGANVLHDAMVATGWQVSWQNFTGADYEGFDKGAVAGYAENPAYCREPDRSELAAASFSNLVATWPAGGGRAVWFGAHWESKEEANQDTDPARRTEPVLGANDGASGVGVLLQLMRHVAARDVQFPFRLGVVFFDGEDGFEDCHPLAGSTYFVSRLVPGEVGRFILLDMVGDPAARFVNETRSLESDPGLWDALWKSRSAGLKDNFPGERKAILDDHVPFIEAGIPAVDIVDAGRAPGEGLFGFPPYWHTTGDALDKLDPAMLGKVGQLLVTTLLDPAFSSSWPEAAPAAP